MQDIFELLKEGISLSQLTSTRWILSMCSVHRSYLSLAFRSDLLWAWIVLYFHLYKNNFHSFFSWVLSPIKMTIFMLSP
jgi:hypothetical protein